MLRLRGPLIRIALLPVLTVVAMACDSTSTIVGVNAVAVDVTIIVENTPGTAPASAPVELLDLMVGETASLVAVATNALGLAVGASAVSWSSSDNAVAAVTSGGVVNGVAAGSASIFASVDGVAANLLVRVQAVEQVPPPAPVTPPVD
jgi:hypothetical protein